MMDLRDNASAALAIQDLAAGTSQQTVAQVRELVLEYGRFVVAQRGTARFCFGSLEQEAARLPQSYIEQGGGRLIAHGGGQPAGFIANSALGPARPATTIRWKGWPG